MTIAATKAELNKAGVPNWAIDLIDGPNGKEFSVSFDVLEDMADPEVIRNMNYVQTDKGLCFPI
jgi:hypothetical protein